MAEAAAQEEGGESPPSPSKKRRSRLLLAATLGSLMLAAGAGAAYQFVPQVAQTIQGLIGTPPVHPVASNRPTFVDLAEMAVTLPNGGHPRQLRIRLSIELAKGAAELPPNELLSPRVYDALLLYLRTLRDGELDGGLAIDRLRSDLYRRLTLVLGPGVVADVLVTGLVVA